MAQLIKLEDFISRYEIDLYRYSSQYIRIKRKRWEEIKKGWKEHNLEVKADHDLLVNTVEFNEDWLKEEKNSFIKWIKGIFGKDKDDDDHVLNHYFSEFKQTSYQKKYSGQTLDELKNRFLNELFDFQLKWASSTIKDHSIIDESYYNDEMLKYFTREFPDNYLLMYHPVFMVKNAPVELDIILLSPSSTWCIRVLLSDRLEVYQTDKGRFWNKGNGDQQKKVLNPMISLNRMFHIVQQIYQKNKIEHPLKKVIFCENGYIEHSFIPGDTIFIDNRNKEEWLKNMKRLSVPIKYSQLKAAKTLLSYCQSTYVSRVF